MLNFWEVCETTLLRGYKMPCQTYSNSNSSSISKSVETLKYLAILSTKSVEGLCLLTSILAR